MILIRIYMVHQIRYLVLGLLLCTVGYFSYRTYLYYFNTVAPDVTVVGVQDNAYYAGQIKGVVKGSSPYKVANLSILLDDKVVQENIPIHKKKFEYPISLDTQDIIDGKHSITFAVTDSSKNQNKTCLQKSLGIDNQSLQATIVSHDQDHKVLQGRCLRVQFQTNKPTASATVQTLHSKYNCFPKSPNSLVYEAIVPLDCEQAAQEYPFSIDIKDYVGNSVLLEDKFQVVGVPFKKKILHVQNNKLKSELEFTSLQERDLEQALEKISQNSVKQKLWTGAFDVPLLMTGTSTEFGVIRTSQERGRTVHRAVDLVAEPRAVVWAAQNGIVVLKDRYTHSGNTVVLDHRHGVVSMYFHLHDFADIEVGQKVKKGNPLGRMGMTGFANGHHLHWEIRVNNLAVDPMQWTQLS